MWHCSIFKFMDTLRLLTHVLCKPTKLFFSTIHGHHVCKHASTVLWKIVPIKTTYGEPLRGHIQGQTCDNESTWIGGWKCRVVIYNQAAHITPAKGYFMIMWTGAPRIVLSIQYLKRKLGSTKFQFGTTMRSKWTSKNNEIVIFNIKDK